MASGPGRSPLADIRPAQRKRADEILRHDRSFGARGGSAGSNQALEGWTLYRIPSTGKSPHTAILRKRGADGTIVAEYDLNHPDAP